MPCAAFKSCVSEIRSEQSESKRDQARNKFCACSSIVSEKGEP